MTPRPFPLRAGIMEVVRVHDVGPSLRRLTFRDDGLRHLDCEHPGEILTLGWAPPGQPLVLPTEGWRFAPEPPPEQHWRNYTVRRHDAEAGEVDVDVVLHGDEGRFSAWARRARPGATLGYAGPRIDWAPLADARWQLLFGDETALPVIAAVLEGLPAGTRALAVVEVEGPADELALASPADLDVRWLHRGRPPGAPTGHLAEAVAALVRPDGPGQAWGAGESLAVRDARRDLQARLGRDRVKVTGYWRHRDTPDDVASIET